MTDAAQALVDTSDSAPALAGLMRDHPLAFAKLWHQDPPRTSQRQAFQQMGDLVTIICGGNRSGKSTGAAQYAVATALSRYHPDTKRWCQLNGVDPMSLPGRPGTVWAVALDSGDSREYMRPSVAQYLPAGAKWRNREGYGRAEVQVGKSRIVFLSVDSGRDGFQGAGISLCWFDEEPGDEGVVNECLMRLVTAAGVGKCLVSMTPLRGLSWLYDRWIAQPGDDVRVHYIHGEDNPYLPEGALAQLLRQYGPHERAARERGEWTTLEGRVYQDWSRHLHVVPSFKPPADWPRYGSIDFGTRNPFVFLLFALDPKDSTLHLIDEHYQREWTLTRHAKQISRMTNHGGPAPEWIVADPEDRGSRLSLAREHGISTIKARKQVRDGLNAVAERLAPDANGQPHLLVHDNCRHTIKEFEAYVWDTSGRRGKDPTDRPTKRNDHAMDAIRYCCVQLQSGAFAIG